MNKIIRFLSSTKIMAVVMAMFFVSITSATFVEKFYGTDIARAWIYHAPWFNLLLLIGGINILLIIIVNKLYRKEKITLFLFHTAFLFILSGAAITRYTGFVGTMNIREGNTENTFEINYDSHESFSGLKRAKLPFSLHLSDFRIERYPGSGSPSWFESEVILIDASNGIREPKRIYMNNVLKYKGYRIYQMSYDADERGTILLVSHDSAGTGVTYAGYLLMTLGMFFSLLNRNSRFRQIAMETRSKSPAKMIPVVFLALLLPLSGYAQDKRASLPAPVNEVHASAFGRLPVQHIEGRIEPINTLSSQVLRKLYRKDKYNGMNSDQVFLGMWVDPEHWQYEPIIRSGHPEIQKILGTQVKYSSFASFFNGAEYILQPYVENVYRKKPAERSKSDNEIIRLDERINITYLLLTGGMMKIFPEPGDSTMTWHTPASALEKFVPEDSAWVQTIVFRYASECQRNLVSGNWNTSDSLLLSIKNYQIHHAASLIPGRSQLELEIALNRINIFDRISKFYGLIGILLLIYQIAALFKPEISHKIPVRLGMVFILLLFALHTAGLVMRWYVSGHAPWSNGYEALIYIAWATILAGIIFSRHAGITLSATSVMAFLILNTAHLSSMDPQITNLMPVLKSKWLIIHVATVTASYGFLALGALLAFINLLLMAIQNRTHYITIRVSIDKLSRIIEMTLILGLYLLTIGTFLGAVWANESWGRYWGWDPKETWALATVLVYAFIVHMHLVPGLNGCFSFNLAALLGFGSVIMTYFGVNFYLSGMHSYARGDIIPIPLVIYYSLGTIVVVAVIASINQRRLGRIMREE